MRAISHVLINSTFTTQSECRGDLNRDLSTFRFSTAYMRRCTGVFDVSVNDLSAARRLDVIWTNDNFLLITTYQTDFNIETNQFQLTNLHWKIIIYNFTARGIWVQATAENSSRDNTKVALRSESWLYTIMVNSPISIIKNNPMALVTIIFEIIKVRIALWSLSISYKNMIRFVLVSWNKNVRHMTYYAPYRRHYSCILCNCGISFIAKHNVITSFLHYW